jgi:serine protease Do
MTSSATAASFANSNAVSVLEKVIAIGNPGGNGISSTVGFVNVDSEIIDLDGDGLREFRVIRTDAAVNSGNSGGGLFNLKGEVVGIVNAKMADDSVDNIGYAIPSNIAKAVSDNIIYYCDGTQVEHPKKILIGITLSHNNKIRSEYNTETGTVSIVETVAVEEVAVGSAAHKLIYAGDIINSITIDGIKYEITRSFQVVDSMINARATSKISINVTRDGKTLDVEIPVDASRLKDWE